MDRNHEDNPILVGQTGPLNGQRWIIHENMIIGREEDCDIMIPSRQVSRRHAIFHTSYEGVLLEDLGSKNGTHLNGQPINSTVFLHDGDIVQIALAQQFIFLSSDATLPISFNDVKEDELPVQRKLKLEKRSRRVWVNGQEIIPSISLSQYQLLELLYEKQGQVVSRNEITSRIWGAEQAFDVSEQALDALVRRLRDRLAQIDPDHQYILTIRGHGLRLDNPPL